LGAVLFDRGGVGACTGEGRSSGVALLAMPRSLVPKPSLNPRSAWRDALVRLLFRGNFD